MGSLPMVFELLDVFPSYYLIKAFCLRQCLTNNNWFSASRSPGWPSSHFRFLSFISIGYRLQNRHRWHASDNYLSQINVLSALLFISACCTSCCCWFFLMKPGHLWILGSRLRPFGFCCLRRLLFNSSWFKTLVKPRYFAVFIVPQLHQATQLLKNMSTHDSVFHFWTKGLLGHLVQARIQWLRFLAETPQLRTCDTIPWISYLLQFLLIYTFITTLRQRRW